VVVNEAKALTLLNEHALTEEVISI